MANKKLLGNATSDLRLLAKKVKGPDLSMRDDGFYHKSSF